MPLFIGFFFRILFLFLISLSLLRVGFFLFFQDPADPLSIDLALHSLYLGLKFDLRLSLLMLTPAIALTQIRSISLVSRRGSLIWTSYFTLLCFLLTAVYLSDFAHFSYVRTRLNATSISLLQDTAISLKMIWETYPVISVLFILIITTSFYGYTIHRLIQKAREIHSITEPLSKRHKIIATALTVFFVSFGIYGKLSAYPLRWSDAFYSTNRFAASLALNPVLYLYDTASAGGLPYDKKKAEAHYNEMADYLGVSNRNPLNYTRQVNREMKSVEPPPNVVMVFLESFSYHRTGLYGSPINTTPHFNDLAKKGILFKNFFTPHLGTARGVFAGITGIPDVETHNTSTRNPLIICKQTIINDFKAHEKFYFLGGSASWGNIRGLLSHNISGLTIYEEGDYQSPRIDVWGISDLALFKEANLVFAKSKKPFFAVIQTAGNHRPYTIPEENDGFSVQSITEKELEQNGFESAAEWNAFRLVDHSLGQFMKIAAKEAYFNHTIFVFFGDHGVTTKNSSIYAPKWEGQLGLSTFHVPFLIYAPELIPNGVVYTKVASQVDVLPTLAGLALNQYTNTTLGRDLLDPQFDTARNAFTIVHGAPSKIGLVDDPFYLVMNDDQTDKQLHRLDTDTPRENLLLQEGDRAKRMEKRLIGIHETSKYMLYQDGDCDRQKTK